MASKFIQIQTTFQKRSNAERIANMLCEKKLSACTQIVGPVTSIYKWKGKTEKSKEWLCIIETRASCYKKVEKAIKEIHPYELPEIIAVPITASSQEYLEWMKKQL